jgi:hypothetical protein
MLTLLLQLHVRRLARMLRLWLLLVQLRLLQQQQQRITRQLLLAQQKVNQCAASSCMPCQPWRCRHLPACCLLLLLLLQLLLLLLRS